MAIHKKKKLSEKKCDQLWEAVLNNRVEALEECDDKIRLRNLVGNFTKELLRTGDVAMLIALIYLLDDLSIEVEEKMRRLIKE